LYADPDPEAQINADPCGSGYGSGSETLVQAYSTDARFVLRTWACYYEYLPISRMFGTDAAFNPDLLSGRLEEILPTIQQVIVPKITAVGLLGARLLAVHVNSTLGRVSKMR
jgi:hypothetical protein